MRPASVSEDWRKSSGEAEPSNKKRPGRRSSSMSARRTSKSDGARWTSSRQTRVALQGGGQAAGEEAVHIE